MHEMTKAKTLLTSPVRFHSNQTISPRRFHSKTLKVGKLKGLDAKISVLFLQEKLHLLSPTQDEVSLVSINF